MKTGFYPLSEEDRDALTAHFLRLSRDDRRLRFCTSMSDAAVKAWCDRHPLANTKGYFQDGQLIAVVILAHETSELDEFAISVDQPYRGSGLARKLLGACIEETKARELAIRHLAENTAMARVYRHYPTQKTLDYGELDVRIDLEHLKQGTADAVAA